MTFHDLLGVKKSHIGPHSGRGQVKIRWGSRELVMGVYINTCTGMLKIAVRRRYSSSISPAAVLSSLKERGLVNNNTKLVSDGVECYHVPLLHILIYCSIPDGSLNGNRPSVYVGFDPTADSLHTGNLVTITALIHFQRAGYQPLAVVSAILYENEKILTQPSMVYTSSLSHDFSNT